MKVQALRGFRDVEPGEMLVRERMMDAVKGVFESFGYAPIHTPALEYAEILLGKYGEEGEKLLYRFVDNGGRDVALRYDLTVPLARFVATHPELRLPFRRYHIAPVWRAERPQRGRFREFYQCDVDLLGPDSAMADAECILVDHSVLQALDLSGCRIHVNHRGFLDGLLRSLHIESHQHSAVLRVLDKVDKVEAGEMEALLAVEGVTGEPAAVLLGLGNLDGSNQGRLEMCRARVSGNAGALDALGRMEEVLAVVLEAGVESGAVCFNPAIARGLDYYTGMVFETFLPPEYQVGSVMSGGRYNGLIGMFSGREVPAVGISLGLDRLASVLQTTKSSQLPGVTRVLVCTLPGAEASGAGLAHKIRRSQGGRGCGVELYPHPVKLKKQLEYAHRSGIPWLVIVGPDDLARDVVQVRNMESGAQEEVSLTNLPLFAFVGEAQ